MELGVFVSVQLTCRLPAALADGCTSILTCRIVLLVNCLGTVMVDNSINSSSIKYLS